MRLVSMECHGGCDEAAVAMFKAALSFVHAQPGGPGRVIEPTPALALVAPKKPRRRRS
jgi:hypothetical protein